MSDQVDKIHEFGAFTQTLHNWMEVSMRRSMQAFARWMSGCGLTKSQIGALMRLYYQGECPISGIGDDLGISTAAASQLVDRLVQMGLIERVEDPNDRRIKQVYLSTAGETLVRHGVEARIGWLDELVGLIDPEKQAAIEDGLQTLISAAKEMEKESV
jgi:DNA-binding MarR family transcriptional regulator